MTFLPGPPLRIADDSEPAAPRVEGTFEAEQDAIMAREQADIASQSALLDRVRRSPRPEFNKPGKKTKARARRKAAAATRRRNR